MAYELIGPGTNAHHQAELLIRGLGFTVFHRHRQRFLLLRFLLRYRPYVALRGIIALTVQILPMKCVGGCSNTDVSLHFSVSCISLRSEEYLQQPERSVKSVELVSGGLSGVPCLRLAVADWW